MIPTQNSIAGEVIRLQSNFSVPMEKTYMKLFNSKQFVVKVARQLERLYPVRNGSPVDENGKKWASTMCFAWFVWEHGYEGNPEIKWI